MTFEHDSPKCRDCRFVQATTDETGRCSPPSRLSDTDSYVRLNGPSADARGLFPQIQTGGETMSKIRKAIITTAYWLCAMTRIVEGLWEIVKPEKIECGV